MIIHLDSPLPRPAVSGVVHATCPPSLFALCVDALLMEQVSGVPVSCASGFVNPMAIGRRGGGVAFTGVLTGSASGAPNPINNPLRNWPTVASTRRSFSMRIYLPIASAALSVPVIGGAIPWPAVIAATLLDSGDLYDSGDARLSCNASH